MVSGIIVAAGKGERMKAPINKVFLKIGNCTILEYTVNAFLNCKKIDEIIIVTGKKYIGQCKEIFLNSSKPIKVISGGATRQQSVYNGICASNGDFVAIHDGARALILPEDIENVVNAGMKYNAATLGVPSKDTIKIINDAKFINTTPERKYVYQIQTPQVFKKEFIKSAHEKCKIEATDDCMLAEAYGAKIIVVDGSYENIKITTPEDMILAEIIMNNRGIKNEF